ncbi:MAG: XTP/dITP diphosphatase [Oscillospiraceae bacterium]|nr:XTP/dITP diphosphatase [Oscillospiraceae bacterium]
MKLVLASNNKKKMKEMTEILGDMGIEVISQREAGADIEVEETGTTFYENARLKAAEACRVTGLASVADDSGLCVDALGGEPGVYSARYGGEGLTDTGRYELLLKNMENEEHRSAKFVSCIVCVFPDGTEITAQGECPGEILRSPRGEGGFGYDPVFYMPEKGKTMAEMTAEEKNAVSHRGCALKKFRSKLEEHFGRGETER